MKKHNLVVGLTLVALLGFVQAGHAEETTMEKVEAGKNKAVDSVKKTYRNAKDETCEMVHGKLECTGKKLVNKSKNLMDKVETKAKEEKNKAD